MVCGYGEQVSYVELVKGITRVNLDKSSASPMVARPLSEAQISYAIADVTYLRDIYLHLQPGWSAQSGRMAVDEMQT